MTAAELPPLAAQLTPDDVAAKCGVTPRVVRVWIGTGVLVPAGNRRVRVKLRASRVGGRWRIAPADLAEFIRAATDGIGTKAELAAESPAARRKRIEAAKRELAQLLNP
ncbi:MAG: helix-turn-helix domain-containing protein [Gemmataceae bacterium]|nr:helix-turn-helix domain-containing protein [Gemmataceae bacterium]